MSHLLHNKRTPDSMNNTSGSAANGTHSNEQAAKLIGKQPLDSSSSISDSQAINSKQLLNAYVYDFLIKSKLPQTAKIFVNEAEIPSIPSHLSPNNNGGGGSNSNSPHSTRNSPQVNNISNPSTPNPNLPKDHNLPNLSVAIDAPQGFLFEWWEIFWDVFQAKNNHSNKLPLSTSASSNALEYYQLQLMKQRQHQDLSGMNVQPNILGIPPSFQRNQLNHPTFPLQNQQKLQQVPPSFAAGQPPHPQPPQQQPPQQQQLLQPQQSFQQNIIQNPNSTAPNSNPPSAQRTPNPNFPNNPEIGAIHTPSIPNQQQPPHQQQSNTGPAGPAGPAGPNAGPNAGPTGPVGPAGPVGPNANGANAGPNANGPFPQFNQQAFASQQQQQQFMMQMLMKQQQLPMDPNNPQSIPQGQMNPNLNLNLQQQFFLQQQQRAQQGQQGQQNQQGQQQNQQGQQPHNRIQQHAQTQMHNLRQQAAAQYAQQQFDGNDRMNQPPLQQQPQQQNRQQGLQTPLQQQQQPRPNVPNGTPLYRNAPTPNGSQTPFSQPQPQPMATQQQQRGKMGSVSGRKPSKTQPSPSITNASIPGPPVSTTNGNAPPGRNLNALQDYQMQLMLLEKQNKKRLDIARRDSGSDINIQQPQPPQPPLPPQVQQQQQQPSGSAQTTPAMPSKPSPAPSPIISNKSSPGGRKKKETASKRGRKPSNASTTNNQTPISNPSQSNISGNTMLKKENNTPLTPALENDNNGNLAAKRKRKNNTGKDSPKKQAIAKTPSNFVAPPPTNNTPIDNNKSKKKKTGKETPKLKNEEDPTLSAGSTDHGINLPSSSENSNMPPPSSALNFQTTVSQNDQMFPDILGSGAPSDTQVFFGAGGNSNGSLDDMDFDFNSFLESTGESKKDGIGAFNWGSVDAIEGGE